MIDTSRVIVICGGGGKTTITIKYPNKFIDIDKFIQSDLVLKPDKKLHLENIKNRTINMQKIAIDNWNMLDNAYIYKTHEELSLKLGCF